VLHATFACKIFLDHPQNICFFVGDAPVHLRLGLAINKIYTKAKKIGLSKTLYCFFRMIKIKRCKRKIKRKTENTHKRNTGLILDYLFPGNGAKKGAC
jgi:hypothetical protein